MIEFDGELTEVRFRPDKTIERLRVVDQHGDTWHIWLDPPPDPDYDPVDIRPLGSPVCQIPPSQPRPRVRVERA
jgi:hypothetical protein